MLVTNAALAPAAIGGVENVTPYVFYVMDRRTDLKPAGWEFVNPLASTTITGDVYNRWLLPRIDRWRSRLLEHTPAGIAFRTGQPLTKNFGGYWEVNLDNVSSTDLQQFDVILMAYHYNQTQFTSDEREKLRHYVDGGGTVWLEDEGGFNIQNGGNYGAGQFIRRARLREPDSRSQPADRCDAAPSAHQFPVRARRHGYSGARRSRGAVRCRAGPSFSPRA